MKKKAPSRLERLSFVSCIPAYPTIAPNTGNVQQVLATALAKPRRKANGTALGPIPAPSSAVLAHSAGNKSQSNPISPFHQQGTAQPPGLQPDGRDASTRDCRRFASDMLVVAALLPVP